MVRTSGVSITWPLIRNAHSYSHILHLLNWKFGVPGKVLVVWVLRITPSDSDVSSSLRTAGLYRGAGAGQPGYYLPFISLGIKS